MSLSLHHSLDHVGNQEGWQQNVGEDADPTRNSALWLRCWDGWSPQPRHPTPTERGVPPGFSGMAKTVGGVSRGEMGLFPMSRSMRAGTGRPHSPGSPPALSPGDCESLSGDILVGCEAPTWKHPKWWCAKWLSLLTALGQTIGKLPHLGSSGDAVPRLGSDGEIGIVGLVLVIFLTKGTEKGCSVQMKQRCPPSPPPPSPGAWEGGHRATRRCQGSKAFGVTTPLCPCSPGSCFMVRGGSPHFGSPVRVGQGWALGAVLLTGTIKAHPGHPPGRRIPPADSTLLLQTGGCTFFPPNNSLNFFCWLFFFPCQKKKKAAWSDVSALCWAL